MERDVAGSRGEVAVIVSAAVALTGLAALIAGGLRQRLRLLLQQLVRGFSTLPRTNSLIWPLIASSFSCTIFSDIVCCLLSEWCVVTSFYQSLQVIVHYLDPTTCIRVSCAIFCYTDIQLKTFIHGMEVFNMKIIMRRDSVILSKSRKRLRQRRNLSDERI